MAIVDTAPEQAPARTAGWQPWLALGLALFCAMSYLVALVLPYYAHGLHHRPEGESLYLHQLSDLWPYDTALGWLVSLLALFALAGAPFVGFGVAAWSAYRLWAERLTARPRLVWLTATAVATASVIWSLTPLADELRIWLVD